MLVTRLTKIAMCLALAGFCLIVYFDNITDPHSKLSVRPACDEHGHDLSRQPANVPGGHQPFRLEDRLWSDHRRGSGMRHPVPRRRRSHVAGKESPGD
jgi:hypothetical protein